MENFILVKTDKKYFSELSMLQNAGYTRDKENWNEYHKGGKKYKFVEWTCIFPPLYSVTIQEID